MPEPFGFRVTHIDGAARREEIARMLSGAQVTDEARAAALDPEDMSDGALMSRSMVLSHADWLGANARRQRLRYQWREFFQDWDILIWELY